MFELFRLEEDPTSVDSGGRSLLLFFLRIPIGIGGVLSVEGELG